MLRNVTQGLELGSFRTNSINRLFERPRLRLEDNIKMYLKEMKCEDVDWMNLVQVTIQ